MTHGLTYLSQTNQVIVLKQGRITEVGTYKELLSKNSDFAELISTYLKEISDESSGDTDKACEYMLVSKYFLDIIIGRNEKFTTCRYSRL